MNLTDDQAIDCWMRGGHRMTLFSDLHTECLDCGLVIYASNAKVAKQLAGYQSRRPASPPDERELLMKHATLIPPVVKLDGQGRDALDEYNWGWLVLKTLCALSALALAVTLMALLADRIVLP